MRARRRFLIVGLIAFACLILLISLIIAIYRLNLPWTGFNEHIGPNVQQYQPSKTLWDWLQLLAILAIPVAVALGTLWFTAKQGRLSIAENKDNQCETMLQAYIDKMSELLFAKHPNEPTEIKKAQNIARVRTLTVLRRLDAERKGSMLKFLQESDLIKRDSCFVELSGANLSRVDLSSVDLSKVKLSSAILSDVDLSGADLSGSDLSEADLSGAIFIRANLSGAILTRAKLSSAELIRAKLIRAKLIKTKLIRASLSEADLREADLSEADLSRANLSRANLSGANLSRANLSEADLSGADLSEADLSEADLSGANLIRANLSWANLSGANLSRTDLLDADLSLAILKNATVTPEQLEKAKSLSNTTMPNGSIHP